MMNQVIIVTTHQHLAEYPVLIQSLSASADCHGMKRILSVMMNNTLLVIVIKKQVTANTLV